MRKNITGQKIGAQMVSATTGAAFTGSVTVYVCGDAGTQAIGSVGSGVCTHEGNGYHTYAPAQAETNYDLIAFTFIGTGAVPATVQIYTSGDANVVGILGTLLTETSTGLIAAAFRKFFNVTSPTGSVNSVPDAAPDAVGGLPITGLRLSAVAGLIWNALRVNYKVPDSFGDVAELSAMAAAVRDVSNATPATGSLGAVLNDIPTTSEFTARTIPAADYVVVGDTLAAVTNVGTVANLTNAPTAGDLTATMRASVNAQVAAALVAIHLDHLLAADYDPASKPGVATALLNELIESDAGVSRFTVNALENGPSGTGASAESIRIEMDANSSKFAAIVQDTNELQVDWANGGRLDALLDLAAAAGGLDEAGVRSAIGLASANLDTQLAPLPDVDEIFDEPISGTYTFRELVRGIAAVLLGRSSGLEDRKPVFRDVANTKDAVSATVDADNNRTAITLNLS